jgi:hypothetical protein
MSKRRYQFSLASLCGIVAASAVGLSQDTLPKAIFAMTWVILLAATVACAFRRQPFWKGFVIAGASYLFLSRLNAYPPPVGQPDAMLGVHSILALTLATLVGTLVQFYNRPRKSLPSS